MIRPKVLRKLDIESASSAGRPRHLAAGSGLVVIRDHFYVVPDDELHLGCFRRSSDAAGRLLRVFPGELPHAPAARKAVKPDLEALVHLPAFADFSNGALLAIPSGSTANRNRGALLGLNAHGGIVGEPRMIDFAPLYTGLAAQVPALNIEGAVIIDNALLLLQRGSRSYPLSALIEISLADVLAGLAARRVIDALQPRSIHWVDAGMIDGVALAITDGVALTDGRIVVTLVAEQSVDSYADGPCLGAAIAVLDRNGQIHQLHRLQPTYKVEGVHAWAEGERICLWLVTDADDESTSGYLLQAELSAPAPTNAASDWWRAR